MWSTDDQQNKKLVWEDSFLVIAEYAIDIFYCVEIFLNFLKRTNLRRTLSAIASDYIYKGFFFIDLVASVSGLYYQEHLDYYFLKCFRIFHLFRLSHPLQLLLEFILNNLSKKRQGDIIGFANVIFFVIYLNHIMACIWILLGKQYDCAAQPDPTVRCTDSWFY